MRIAVLGTGHMARLHCARLAELADVTLAAVVSRSGGDLATSMPRVAQIAQLKALENPVDLALVCLPSHLHRGAVEELAEFVPHIICEKPAALSLEDACAMAELAHNQGCNLMIAQVVRAWDSYTALADLVRQDRDRLHKLTLRRRQPRPAWSAGNWMGNPGQSGGILFDLAIHDVDFVTHLFGPPQSVSAALGPNGESATIFLRYDTFCAVLESSWCLPQSFSGGVLETWAEAAFTDRLVVFDSRQSLSRYQLFDGTSHTQPEFPTWDPYSSMLNQMLGLARAGILGAENPYAIASVLPAMAVCQAAWNGMASREKDLTSSEK